MAADPQPAREPGNKVTLSVIIPVYNEIRTIEEILRRVRAVAIAKEVIIVDDGSTDGTREFLRSADGADGVKVIFHARNKGKGAAIRTAIPNVTGDIVLIQDADLEYDPRDYPRIIAPIVEGRAG